MSELSKNAILYMPEQDIAPLLVVQIIHGFADYQGRYRELAHALTQEGFAVITSDLRGHGNHIARNSELGFFGDNAVARLIGDIHDISRYVKDHFPEVPYVIFAQGMGALLATAYFKKYDNFVDGLFLSGMPADHKMRPALSLLIRLMIVLRGEYHRSRLIDSLMIGGFTRAFRSEGSDFGWLSADPDNSSRYEDDPKCGFIYTLNGFKTLTELMGSAYTSGSWIRKKLNCPVRLFCGMDDPCTLGKTGFMRSVHLFSDHGYKNVAYIAYPDQRHEVFRDDKKETAFRDLRKELEAICDAQPEPVQEVKPTHIVLEDFIDPEVEKPLVKEEEINLEDFINAHSTPSGVPSDKVEMIDFTDIEKLAAAQEPRDDPQELDELEQILASLDTTSDVFIASKDDEESKYPTEEFSDPKAEFKDPKAEFSDPAPNPDR